MSTNAADTFEIPAEVSEALNEEGQVTKLQNTLLKIWNEQAKQALIGLSVNTTPGFGFSISAAQRWGLDRTQDIKDYTRFYIDTSRLFWMSVVECAEHNPEALKIPVEGPDGEVNKELYVELINVWFKLSHMLQTEWTIAEGLPKAYAIQDVLDAFVGAEGIVRQVSLVPGFDGSDVVLWTPETDGE
jgi:hypothetical protein